MLSGEWWTGWLAHADRGALIVGAELVLGALLLPLWSAWLDGRRWGAMRRRIARGAFTLYRASAADAVEVSRALLRDQDGTPLARLATVRGAIENQRRENARFRQLAALTPAAISPRLAALVEAANELGDTTERALTRITRHYLKEARVLVASNVVHGEDLLRYDSGQVIATADARTLEALVSELGIDAEAVAHALARQLGRADRRRLAVEFEAATGDLTGFGADVRGFLAGLQPTDPESVEYRTRRRGERAVRTLEGLIARFDRGGVLTPDLV